MRKSIKTNEMSIKILVGILMENISMILNIYTKVQDHPDQNHPEENKVGKFALP